MADNQADQDWDNLGDHKHYGRTKRNGCMNDVVNEDELFELLCSEQYVAWDGVENMDSEDFKDIDRIEIFADGRVRIKRKNTSNTSKY